MSEAARLADVAREIRVIQTVLTSDRRSKKIRSYALSNCEESLFGFDPAREVLEKIIGLYQIGQPVSKTILSEDRTLSTEAKRVVQSTNKKHKPYKKRDDLRAALQDLSRLRTRRAIFKATSTISDGLAEGAKEEDLLAAYEHGLVEARSRTASDAFLHSGFKDESSSLPIAKKVIRGSRKASIKTCIPEFDHKTGGYFRGNLVIKMARRGAGKSSQDLSECVDQYLYCHYNVCFVNLEMSNEEFMARLLARLTGIDHRKIARGQLSRREKLLCSIEYRRFRKIGQRHNCRFSIYKPSGTVTSEQLAIVLAPMGYDVITIDHLRALSPNPGVSNDAKHSQYEDHAKTLKQGLAENRFKSCVVKLLTHMTEDWELKHSRSVEDWADFIWAWRMSRRDRKDGQVRVRQMKARNAEEYDFTLWHDLPTHTWNGTKDRSLWSNNDDDGFESDKIARAEKRASEPNRRGGGGGSKRSSKGGFKPKDTENSGSDVEDLGMESFG